jgi:urease accessory protein
MNNVRQRDLSVSTSGNGAHRDAPPMPRGEFPTATDWLMWQLADSAFPTGGFAHSSGLEAAWQHGEVRNRAELTSFIEAGLHQFGRATLPFMTAAHRQPANLAEADDLSHAFLSNHVANRASRLQGQAMLASARRIFKRPALDKLHAPHGHLAPVFGAVIGALEISAEAAANLFLFTHLRGLIAAGVRLGIVGPMEAQSLQHEFTELARKILIRSLTRKIDDVAQTAPLQEIWQGAQDRLYSRLFQS